MNTAEYLIKRLEQLGISDIFGVPGDYNFNIIYAVQNNPETKWIGCTNELNAGYAADGYARQKGYGAIITTYGVGELSAINAIAGSYAENVPVIHIVGVPSSQNIETNKLIHHNVNPPQPYNFYNAYKSVTSGAVFLDKNNVVSEIDRILKIFIKEKSPVYIAIPDDVATQEVQISNPDELWDWTSDRLTLEEAATLILNKINSSIVPVILSDVLIKRFNAVNEFKSFVEESGIPVTNLQMGAGIIDESYEKNLGTYLASFGNKCAEDYINNTDCLISIGTIYADINSCGMKIPFDINSHIAIYGTHCYINGKKYENVKMSELLLKLSNEIKKREFKVEKEKSENLKTETKNSPITLKYVYKRLQEFLKKDDIFFAETGSVPFGAANMILPDGIDLEEQLLWCSIGWATPAAFGAAIARPSQRVVLLTGDGAHQMTALEVGNMFRYGVKPIIIVLNNSGYTIERVLSGEPENEFNEIASISYSKFVRIFNGDVWASRVLKEEDFDKALRVTQIMDKLCYIEVIVDKADTPELLDKQISLKGNKPIKAVPVPEESGNRQFEPEKIYATTIHAGLKEYE